MHNAKVCRKHGRLDLYKVWYLAVEILRGCVPAKIPEVNRVITDGHQVLIDNLDSDLVIMDENWQRDQQLAEVKNILYNTSNVPKIHKKQVDSVVVMPLQRVKWGMHPLGQKLVDAL